MHASPLTPTRPTSRYVPLLLSVVFVALLIALWIAPAPRETVPPPRPPAVASSTSSSSVKRDRPAVRETTHKRTPAGGGVAGQQIAAPNALCQAAPYARVGTVRVATATASAYIEPARLQTPLATFSRDTSITTTERQGDWFFVRFDDPRWGRRVGFIHCSELASASPWPLTSAPPSS